MRAVRDAVGLFRTSSLEEHIPVETGPERMRVPADALKATEPAVRSEIVTAAWVDHVSKNNPLRKDRPQIFITRKGRKVGIQTAREGEKFAFPDRPLNVVVLLLEQNGLLHDYVLPPKLVQEHWKSFARENGSVLIELKKGALLSTASGEVPLREYEGDYSALQ